MKIIDISREIFTSPCYADDPQPHYRWHKSLYAGDEFNLSVLSMTPHAGTHIDAPVHFIKHGKSVEECSLEKCFGPCTVITISGVLTGEDMDRLLPHCAKRLLIHGSGDAVLELSAARVITENKLLLVGTDGLSIAFNKQEEAVHRELLSNGTVILENLC
ncbi:MAG: cyclase family protein, partial [Clostridia bacterium]|nr:cyclase family protein [Clostridia bacterium]